jgi:transcriptional regulator with XRE-family HTH domain
MARQNLSQNDLARALEVSSGYVSLLINGQRFPSPGLRRLLLQALPTATFDDLFIVERRGPDGDYVVINGGPDDAHALAISASGSSGGSNENVQE